MTGLWQWLYDASLSKTLRDSAWAFPIIECIHIYSMVSLIALFAGFDMRLMGFAMGGRNRRPIPELATTVLHWGVDSHRHQYDHRSSHVRAKRAYLQR